MIVPKLIRAAFTLLSLLAAPAFAGEVTLTGTVTYYERIAMPPDARLQVTLVKQADATPVVGASSSIPAIGGVPISFTLNLRSEAVETDRAYGLLAEISSAGRVMFRNTQPVQVDLQAPAPVDIVVNFSPAPPHDPPQEQPTPMPPPMPPSDLLDTSWKVTSIGGNPVTGSRALTLSVASDHQVGGSAGCNNYFTEVRIAEQGKLSFGPPAATRMACDPAIMAQEAAYFTALVAVSAYELGDTDLRLLDAAGVPLVGLVRADK